MKNTRPPTRGPNRSSAPRSSSSSSYKPTGKPGGRPSGKPGAKPPAKPGSRPGAKSGSPYKPSPYKSSARDDSAPRKSYARDDSPRKTYAREDAPRKSFTRDDSPRSSYAREDAPRKSYARDDSPRKSYSRDDSPRASYARDDAPRRETPYKKAPYKSSATRKDAPYKKPYQAKSDAPYKTVPVKAAPEKPVFEKPVVEKVETSEKTTNLMYGLHAVRQAWLNPERRCTRLLLTDSGKASFDETLQEAQKAGITRRPQPQIVQKDQLDKMLPGAVHQGIALDAPALADVTLEDILRAADTRPASCIVVLDQVTDPHNVGAILRSAAAFGALAVILPERNAPPLTGVLAKTASGAADIVPMVRVNNLGQALDQMREAGFWSIGFAESGKETLSALDLSGKIALVMGAEGEGLRRLTMERCDIIARLPTVPPIGSLNVSNAAAVALYEFVRRNPPVVAAAE